MSYPHPHWGEATWEKSDMGSWHPTLSYSSPDPYTWFSHPVATPGRWAAWGQVDRALDSYLRGEMSAQPTGPVVPYAQPQQSVGAAWESEALDAAQRSAVEAAHHAQVARGAATRLTLGNVGELVESVGALADTVRRMEERSVLIQERDSARLQVLELQTALAKRADEPTPPQEETKAAEPPSSSSSTDVAPLPAPVKPHPQEQSVVAHQLRNDDEEEAAARRRAAQERQALALMEQNAALAEQQAKQALLLHERQTLMAERQLLAERRQLEADRAAHEAPPPQPRPPVELSDAEPAVVSKELADAKLEIAKLAGACEVLKERVTRAELNKRPSSSSGSSSGGRRRSSSRRSRRHRDDDYDHTDDQRYEEEVARRIAARDAADSSAAEEAKAARDDVAALRRELRNQEERAQARELAAAASAASARADAEAARADKAEAARAAAEAEATRAAAKAEVEWERAAAKVEAARVAAESERAVAAQRSSPAEDVLTASRVRRFVDETVAAEAERLRRETEARLAEEREKATEAARAARDKAEFEERLAARQREAEDRLVKRVEALLAVVARPPPEAVAPAFEPRRETPNLAPRPAAEPFNYALPQRAVVAEPPRRAMPLEAAPPLTIGDEVYEDTVPPAEETPRGDQQLYKTMSSAAGATPSSMLRFDVPAAAARSSLDLEEPGNQRAETPGVSPARTAQTPPRWADDDDNGDGEYDDTFPDNAAVLTPRWTRSFRSHRAVKLTFGDMAVPSETEIVSAMGRFGDVVNCGRRQTAAVVLFGTATSAARAARDYQGPWRVQRVAEALTPVASTKKRPKTPFSLAESSPRGFESRTLDVVWPSTLAPADDREFRAHFAFFGSIARSFRHAGRGMIMFASADECDRCLDEYDGPWTIARVAATGPPKRRKVVQGEAVRAVAARAVRCTFGDGGPKTEGDVRAVMSRFGAVVKTRLGETSAVVMYAEPSQAEAAVRLYRGSWLVDRADSLLGDEVSADAVRTATIKVVWPASGAPPPSEAHLRHMLGDYGAIKRVAVRRRSAVVLYDEAASALHAVESYAGPWRLRRLFQQPDLRLAEDDAAPVAAPPPAKTTIVSKGPPDLQPDDEAEPPRDAEAEPPFNDLANRDESDDSQSDELPEDGDGVDEDEPPDDDNEEPRENDAQSPRGEQVNATESALVVTNGAPVVSLQEERAQRKETMLARLDEPDDLKLRCAKVSWRIKPKNEASFSRALAVMGVVYVRSVVRVNSAVVMFASAAQAARAVETLNASGGTWSAVIVTAPLVVDDSPTETDEANDKKIVVAGETKERLAIKDFVRQELVRHEQQELSSSDLTTSVPSLEERCVKVDWDSTTRRPRDETDLERCLNAMGILFISAKVRQNSAIVMFADASLARKAVHEILARKGRPLKVAGQFRVLNWSASLVVVK